MLALPLPAQANLSDDIATTTYTATCETIEICRESSGCVSFPTFGVLILQVQGDRGSLGPEADDPRPLNVYHALESAPPDPEDLGLRFIVEQEATDPLTRRFAYVDQTRAGPAGRYFMLECTERSE
ncbi:hypothetical protein [Gymnodinialimonas hymeniacidonis]|uniref:hypothetical protein n=1 Tax=Gymnodinialimonas hymeniacidonis TaxID=3126508 RepID=UPI0034C653E7